MLPGRLQNKPFLALRWRFRNRRGQGLSVEHLCYSLSVAASNPVTMEPACVNLCLGTRLGEIRTGMIYQKSQAQLHYFTLTSRSPASCCH
ncbi:Acyl-CoA synthetase family member 2 [Fusarium oxysporum f. sp. albedinis]|nr:Acyl-CoA synthetase family member 2 [Fusarium oxysporum f. sp. albedinis]